MRRVLIVLGLIGVAAAGCSGGSSKPGGGGLTAINGPANVATTASIAGATPPTVVRTPDSVASTSTTVVSPAAPATSAEPTTVAPAPAPTSTFPSYSSAVYSDPSHWICRGDTLGDPCDDPYPITQVAADGSLTVQNYTVDQDAPVDCFYVYPTSSSEPTLNSDYTPTNEVNVTKIQVGRFNQVCKIYAPMYRSLTLAGLSGKAKGDAVAAFGVAYGDVLDAWKYYLANLNHGRPVVIISHSQGSFHVQRLLREEIDPNPAERQLVVSAILPGTSFHVAPGKDVGGDTQNMPLCRSNDQTGCVITFQSFRDSVPPQPGAIFGAPGVNQDSACTNPAALAGGPGLLDTAFPAGAWVLTAPNAAAAITTPRIGTPGLITAECKVKAGYSYLAITVNADPADPRADDIPGDGTPNWGLHVDDLNITQDSLIAIIKSETAAFLHS